MTKKQRYYALAKNYTDVGLDHHKRGEWKNALDYHEKSLVINSALNDRESQADNYENLGIAYDALGLFDKSLDAWKKTLVLQRILKRKAGVVRALGNIGAVYANLGNMEKAAKFWRRSQALSINTHVNLGAGKIQNWLSKALELTRA